MMRQLRHFASRAVPCAAIGLVLAACGGGKSGPAAPTPGVPLLSNLVATFLQACTSTSGFTGTVLAFTVDYRDSDGDIRGGTLQSTVTLQPSNTSQDLNFSLPSANATVTGTTEGQVQAAGCLRFGSQTGGRLSVAVVDAAGHSSNVVATQLNRPSGAPEVPQGGTDGAFGPLN